MRNPQYTIHNIYFDAFGIYIQFFITMIEDMMVVAHHLLDQPEEVAPFIQQGGAWCQMDSSFMKESLGQAWDEKGKVDCPLWFSSFVKIQFGFSA